MVEERRGDNLITSAGRALLGLLLGGGVQLDAPQVTVAIGTGSAAPSVADTAFAALVGVAPASTALPVADGGEMKVAVSATFPGAGLAQV